MKLMRAWVAGIALLVTGIAWGGPILTITPVNNGAYYPTPIASISFIFHIANTGNATLAWNGFTSVNQITAPAGFAGSITLLASPRIPVRWQQALHLTSLR